MRRMCVAIALGIAVSSSAAPGSALADSTPEEKGAATVLFRDARAMMDRGDVAAACRRFEESQRLDPLPGTLLNMAVCHEKEGRTATAWVEFRDAAALARRDARDDRVTLAEEHMKGLEPRLSTVRIVVGMRADVPSLEVTLDGSRLARPAWDTPLPVDPGEHVVKASAPSRAVLTRRVEVVGDGEAKTVSDRGARGRAGRAACRRDRSAGNRVRGDLTGRLLPAATRRALHEADRRAHARRSGRRWDRRRVVLWHRRDRQARGQQPRLPGEPMHSSGGRRQRRLEDRSRPLDRGPRRVARRARGGDLPLALRQRRARRERREGGRCK